MKTEKLVQKVMDIYTEMYAQATPFADFQSLMDNAEINEFGQKEIPFNDYVLDAKIAEEIIKKHSKGLNKLHKKQIYTTVTWGCSPKYK